MLTWKLILMVMCSFLPCLPEAISEAVILQINIGIIVDSNSMSVLTRNYTTLPCNITVHWFPVDFRELYQVYRTTRILDENRDDIDLIVLLGYGKHSTPSDSLLHTQNKRLIMLQRRPTPHNLTQLENLVLNYSSTNLNATLEQSETPYCKTWHNESHFESSLHEMGDTMATAPPAILAQLVGEQSWGFMSVLHDSSTEYETRLFVDSVSGRGTVFTLYNVEHVVDLHATLFEMYHEAVRLEQRINVVVMCKLDSLVHVMHTANTFDSVNKQYPSLLQQFSRWIAVVYDYNANASFLLQTVARDLDNVAILPVPGLSPPSPQDIVLRLRQLPSDIFTQSPTNESKTFHLHGIAREILRLEPTSKCSLYVIETLCWTKEGRQFSTVGHADLEGHVTLTSQLFPNTKYGYSGRRFRVTTEIYEPYISVDTNDKNETTFGGIYIDLLTELSRVLNFTYTIVFSPDRKYGSVDKTESGTDIFNGMVGMLQRHEVDFAAAPLTIIPARERVVDFSYPVSYEYTSVLMKKPDPNAEKWRTLLNPFKLDVLLYIGLSLPIVTILIFVLEKFGGYYALPAHAKMRKEAGGLHHLHDSFWYMYGALLCQGGVHLPDSFAGRTFVSAWWIFCIIIVGTYSGNLIAFLTVSKVTAPFNTLEEMLGVKGQYKWGTQGGTVWETVFTTSKNPSFRRIGDAMKEFNETDSNIFHIDEGFHRERVKDGDYGWIVDATTTEVLMASACDLTTIKEKVLPMKDAFAFQQNSPHTAIFSQQIMKAHEAGLFEIWRRKWWPKTNFCAHSNQLNAKPITLRDVQSAYYVCGIAFFVGATAFVVEIVVYKCRERLHEKRKSRGQEHSRETTSSENRTIQT